MIRLVASLAALCLLYCSSVLAQQIGGVINMYTKVVDVDTCRNQLSVQSTAGFSVGSSVLIIQMQGAEVQLQNSVAFGRLTTTAEAGQHEFARIASISNGVITLENKLLRNYDAGIAVQLVSVPLYADVTINADLRPKPWDGVSGGVLVVEASGTITMQADIDASGSGFRGGRAALLFLHRSCAATYSRA